MKKKKGGGRESSGVRTNGVCTSRYYIQDSQYASVHMYNLTSLPPLHPPSPPLPRPSSVISPLTR